MKFIIGGILILIFLFWATKSFAQNNSVEIAENIAAGQKFLEENSKKPGVVTLESGLQYLVIIEGTGAQPTSRDKVTTHYHGTLIDGTVFDSSVDRGTPATFPVNGVIKGWQEGLPLMSEGAKYRFFIPHHLAYGERGAGAKIKGGATLIFDVELFTITPSKKRNNPNRTIQEK